MAQIAILMGVRLAEPIQYTGQSVKCGVIADAEKGVYHRN